MKRKLYSQADVGDLIQDGWFGLRHAVAKFDPTRGVAFATYASQRIRGAILDGIRERDAAPRLMRQRGTAPKVTSIETRIYRHADKPSTLGQTLECAQSAASIAGVEERDGFDRLLVGLSRHEELVVKLYFRESITLKEIGRYLDLSESRVSQILSGILPRLKAKILRGREAGVL